VGLLSLIFLAENYLDQKESENKINALRQEMYANFTQKEAVNNSFKAIEERMPKLSSEISQLRGVVNKHQNDFSVLYENMAQV
jgi:predicted  nucleic acid-binding Zn-ribbon protein